MIARFLRRLLGSDDAVPLTFERRGRVKRDSALVLPDDPREPVPESLIESGRACPHCGRPKQPEARSCHRAPCKAQATKARRQQGRQRAKVLGGRWER